MPKQIFNHEPDLFGKFLNMSFGPWSECGVKLEPFARGLELELLRLESLKLESLKLNPLASVVEM